MQRSTFDFDFIPAVVETLCWSENRPYRDGGPDDFLESIIAVVKRGRRNAAAAVLANNHVFTVNPAAM